jgi:hypothetical protein
MARPARFVLGANRGAVRVTAEAENREKDELF